MTATAESPVSPDRAGRAACRADERRDAPARCWQCTCGQSYRVVGLDRHRIVRERPAPAVR